MMIGQSADKSYAYLLGVYLGDGCVRQNGTKKQFAMNTIDLDFATAVQEAFEMCGYKANIHGPMKDKRFSKSSAFYTVNCSSQEMCQAFESETNRKQRLPSWIMDASKPNRIAFIAGIMDSEGFVAEQKARTAKGHQAYYMGYKSCDVWVNDLIRLLEITGVKIGKVGIEQPRKEGYKTPTRFTIKMQSWIDSGCYFNIQRKQSRVNEFSRRLISETIRQAPVTGDDRVQPCMKVQELVRNG
jgi:LAGLIDADG DNA endonuclease family protein